MAFACWEGRRHTWSDSRLSHLKQAKLWTMLTLCLELADCAS